jgi:hypothetical protein
MMALRTVCNYDIVLDVASRDADGIQFFLLLEGERNLEFSSLYLSRNGGECVAMNHKILLQ